MAAIERHYTVSEVASLWQLSEETVRRLFKDYSGVLKLGAPESRFKRAYIVLRIPESILQKRHAELHGRLAA